MQLTERNYEIYNKELLAIVEALTKWKQYLLDATEKFKVWTDHKNLKYFKKPQKLNKWQAWENNRIVYVDRQIYIPNDRKIWEQVLWEHYDLTDIGHPGQTRMLELIKWKY